MKTVITSTGDNTSAKFDLRFGRCSWFCIYNEDSKQIEFIENPNKNAMGGAGIKSAEQMAEIGAGKVISGDFGPKAKELLNQLKIQMVIMKDNQKTIKEIIDSIM